METKIHNYIKCQFYSVLENLGNWYILKNKCTYRENVQLKTDISKRAQFTILKYLVYFWLNFYHKKINTPIAPTNIQQAQSNNSDLPRPEINHTGYPPICKGPWLNWAVKHSHMTEPLPVCVNIQACVDAHRLTVLFMCTDVWRAHW